MRISISVATAPSPMPQIMFAGDLDRHCAQLAHMGYDGIDLFCPDMGRSTERSVSHMERIFAANGLRVTMLAAQSDLMADGLFLNQPETLPRLLERSRRHLAMAASLEAMPNVGFLRGRISGDRAESLRHMAEGLAAYCELAAEFGVRVLLEPINRYEINSVNTTQEALELLAAAGNPANGLLLLDLFHMNMEESSLAGACQRAAGRVGHVHFVENTRAVPGHGCLPLGTVVECLTLGGYDAFLGIEAIPGPDPLTEAAQGLACTRALLGRPGRTA